MTKKWVQERKKELTDAAGGRWSGIYPFLYNCPFIDETERKIILGYHDKMWQDAVLEGSFLVSRFRNCLSDKSLKYMDIDWEKVNEKDIEKWRDILSSLPVEEYVNLLQEAQKVPAYEDSEEMEFDGDVVITDPCYIMKKMREEERYWYERDKPSRESFINKGKTEEEFQKACKEYDKVHGDDWMKTQYGLDMKAIGITNCISRDTLVGDWSCTVGKYKEGFGKYFSENYIDNIVLMEGAGRFCADSGMVIIAGMEQVAAYNPNFPAWAKEHSWAVCIIKNFKGTGRFVVKEKGFYYDRWYAVHAILSGEDKNTGEKIDYISQ